MHSSQKIIFTLPFLQNKKSNMQCKVSLINTWFLDRLLRKVFLVSFSIKLNLLGTKMILGDSSGLCGSHEILHSATGSNYYVRKNPGVNLLTADMCDSIHNVNFNKENPAENHKISASLSKTFNLFFSCAIE